MANSSFKLEHPLERRQVMIGSPCKALFRLLCFASLIAVTAVLTDTTTPTVTPLQPSDLCINFPNPTSYHAIGAGRWSSIYAFCYILHRSLAQANATMTVVAAVADRIGDQQHKSTLIDCLELMEDSCDLIVRSASAAAVFDARTLMSGVLTNQVACLDGLSGGAAKSILQPHLESLGALASASLAVLSTVEAASERTSTAAG